MKNSNLFSTRLFFYQLFKKARIITSVFTIHRHHSRRNTIIISILFLAAAYGILNEKYAWKLIFEQECFPNEFIQQTIELIDKNDENGNYSDNCLIRTWERYTHNLSFGDAQLLHLNIGTDTDIGSGIKKAHCSNIIRLGHWVQDGGWDICADDFQPKVIAKQQTQKQIHAPKHKQKYENGVKSTKWKQNNRNTSNKNYNDNLKTFDPKTAYPCIVYSFGINDDPSFDQHLVHKWPSCNVYAFDPSINRQSGDTFLGPNIHFYNIGLGGEDKVKVVRNDIDNTDSNWNIMTLDSIMKMLNHDHVNLVKMDIEGDEWETFESWEESSVYTKIGQLIGEIHFSHDIRPEQRKIDHIREVNILKRIQEKFGFYVSYQSNNFRWSRLINVSYDDSSNNDKNNSNDNKMKKSVRTYRCHEIGWRRK